MLSVELVRKHVRCDQSILADSKQWFPVYDDGQQRSFRTRVEEQHWVTRSVNERMNNLTREALELLASDPEMAERVSGVGRVFVISEKEKVFTGFRNGSAKSGGEETLVLDLQGLADEMDQLPMPHAKWCVVS